MDRLRDSLQALNDIDLLLFRLRESGLSDRFPDAGLTFLDLVVRERAPLMSDDLQHCLDAIRRANPALETDLRFQRLMQYLRRFGV